MSHKYFSVLSGVLLSACLCAAADNNSVKATPNSFRALDYSSLPSGADLHHRTKWSNDVFLYIDDDAGAPSLYVFDRSGRVKFTALILIPAVDEIRLDDFAAASDGSVWAAGHAISKAGGQIFYLAHITGDGDGIHILPIASYQPCQLTVAPDGTVWTAGYAETRNISGQTQMDQSQNVIRHFDSSGKLIASALPANTVGFPRAAMGYLSANQDRIGWYSPIYGPGAYVEFSPDMKILHSYPAVPATGKGTLVEGFALTPAARAFVKIVHTREDGRPAVLYELDRAANGWVPVDISRNADGIMPMLEGNDGESLVFVGPPDKSKLQIFGVSQLATR